jgi:disulfide bond formation protein DsbB
MNDTVAVQDRPSPPASTRCQGFSPWTWAALAVALLALAGSLALSWALGLKACPLCYYQRTFVMGVAAVLLVGLLAGVSRRGLLSLLSLPLAVGALAVAVWHTNLEQRGTLECPRGLFGLGSAPQQSLAVLAVLSVLLLLDVITSRSAGGFGVPAAAAPLVLGLALALGAVTSAAGAPPPTQPYKVALDEDGCRPVYIPPRK